MRILVVATDPAGLQAEGWEVVSAASVDEALARAEAAPCDAVVVDGPALACRRLRDHAPLGQVPLVWRVPAEDDATVLAGLGAGADDVVARDRPAPVLVARLRVRLAAAGRARALGDELARKTAELDAFAYSISHDLRAPLRSVDGFSQALVEDHAAALDERARDYLGRVRAGAQRLNALIDDLLQLSRVSRAELRRRPVDLSSLARTLGEEQRQQRPGRTVDFQVADNLSAEADLALCRLALSHLLDNAWKFTGGKAAARIEVGATGDTFFVRDDGAGFDMTYARKLFSPFQRLHADTVFPGRGIGLAIVQRIVDRHGGRVWAEAHLDQGATFSFTLPGARPGGRADGD